MADPRDDLVGHDCERCGRTHPGPEYNGEPGFCCAPWSDEDRVTCDRMYIARLEARLAEAKRGLAAWEALCDAFRFHEPYKTLDAQPGYRCHAGDPGPDRQWRYLAYGNGPTKTLAVVSLATKLGLIPEAK